MTGDVIITFDPPASPISMNEGDSWDVRTRAAAWRDAAYWAWCQHHPGVGPSGRAAVCPAEVRVSIPFALNRRRDRINYAKTVKHIVDGLVLAGAWPDDTEDYVSQMIPALRTPTTIDRPDVIVRISARMEE